MILALVVRVGQEPSVEAITGELESLKSLVGGYIEAVRLDADTILYCNEDGMNRKLPFNCIVGGHNILGNFVLVGFDGSEDECSLKPESVKKWREQIRVSRAAQAEWDTMTRRTLQ